MRWCLLGSPLALVFPSAISPNGYQLAFVASYPGSLRLIWVPALDAAVAQPLRGTEPTEATLALLPDSRGIRIGSIRLRLAVELPQEFGLFVTGNGQASIFRLVRIDLEAELLMGNYAMDTGRFRPRH